MISSCQPDTERLKTGTWRGVIEIQGMELPFNFTVEEKAGRYVARIKNAGEELVLDDVQIKNDSVSMTVHIFDATFKAKITGDELQGEFVINYADDYRLPFHARHDTQYRFVPVDYTASVPDFSGKYAVQFFNENNTVDALGIITQQGNYVEGTFLTPTGDYRYLEGNVVNDTLWLSSFDGNHLFLFNAVKSGDTLNGIHWLGRSRNRKWQGIKNDAAQPPSSESLTFMKEGYDKLEFTFPDAEGQPVSLNDERFNNKVVVLQIMGSWCPNCMDETRFLSEWYPKNKDRGVEIIGLAYEQKADFDYASGRVKKMKEKLNVPYTVLIAGTNTNASETLPALNKVIGFPTTIFVGKDGKVKHIHTGFSGPGTGAYYIEQQERFNETVNYLINSH
ncbi:MAG: TlpA family protein disulfide reductase [Cyclobacteriaceae bacterium]|nr:TlpA family protein disulfide reductase [Cyclobacteriaceae bacterium]